MRTQKRIAEFYIRYLAAHILQRNGLLRCMSSLVSAIVVVQQREIGRVQIGDRALTISKPCQYN